MKRVVCVLGSPRSNGNSETIAKKLLETMESLGAQTRTFVLNDLDIKGCQACMGCKTGADGCVVEDDISDVLKAVREADVLVMTSPIYFGQVTGQLKCFIDRMYSFFTPQYMTDPNHRSRLAPGKKCVLITTQGDPDAASFNVIPMFHRFLGPGFMGYENYTIRGVGLNAKTDAASNTAILKEAEEVAKKVMA